MKRLEWCTHVRWARVLRGMLRSVLFFLPALVLGAQEPTQENLNHRYRYPLSIGVGFDGEFLLDEAPINRDTGSPEQLSVFGGHAIARIPIPELPVLQPNARLGVVAISAPAEVEREQFTSFDWSNNLIYLAPGVGVAHRLSKGLELGVDLYGGGGLIGYPRRLDTGTLRNLGVVAGADAGLTLSPFFNLGIDLRGYLRYRRSFRIDAENPAIDRYDGVTWGVTAALNLRLGTDPDAEQGSIRAIRFGEPKIQPLFAAMQSFYATNPVGSIDLTNIEDSEITDVEVLFNQSGYMDGPTPAARVPAIAPGESRNVQFPAAFNASVFDVEGVTPLTGQVIVRYRYDDRAVEQTQPVTYDLYDKTSLTWNDNRKMGAFITPADSSIRNYASEIARSVRDDTVPGIPDELQFAMQAYHALADRGMLYQPDPSSPFAQVQEDTVVVDSVSLPRDTINRITGDCDDLTALYNTILETRGIETAFVTTPGHIYSAFRVNVPVRQFAEIHPDRDMTLVDGTALWVLVEITVVGRGDFMEAWRTGIREYKRYDDEPERRGFYKTSDAQKLFRPVGLRSTDERPTLDDPAGVASDFRRDRDQLAQAILGSLRREAEQRGRARNWTRLGIAAAELHQFATAENAFTIAGDLPDGDQVVAAVNIGSMYFMQGEHEMAVDALRRAQQLVEPRRTRVSVQSTLLLNLS